MPNLTKITATLVEKELFKINFSEKELIVVNFKTIDYIPNRKTFNSLADTNFVTLENNQVAVYDSTTSKWLNKELEDIVVDVLFVRNETPTKITTVQFQTEYTYNSSSLQVFYNGMKIHSSEITQDSNRLFTLPIATISTDSVEVSYIRT